MNILFFPSWFDSEELPGAGSFFSEQAKALKNAGNTVTVALVDIVYFPYKCKTKRFSILKQIRDDIEVYRIKVPSYCTGQIPFLFFMYYRFFYRKLMNYLEKEGYKFDIIYAHSFWHAGYIGTIYKRKYGIPLLVQEHRSLLITNELSSNINKYLKKTVEEADAFYCVSERLKENVYKRTGIENKIQVLPNMVNNAFSFKKLPRLSMFSFSFVGNLNDGKRILFLLKAFEKFCKNRDHVKLFIAGDGPLRNDIANYIASSSDLSHSVELLGFLTRNQIVDLLTKSNAFILPSAYETFGVVYIEAMAIGRPVIATKNGGANDIVNDTNGYLVDIDNEEQLISAMTKMTSEYSRFNLQNISRDCLSKYSQDIIMGRVLETMDRLISK